MLFYKHNNVYTNTNVIVLIKINIISVDQYNNNIDNITSYYYCHHYYQYY